MKWSYGRQDWKTIKRGLENCYLTANGLGGFSSLTMTGAAARNDHAVLMACTKAPNNRINVIHRVGEYLSIGERTYTLSTQEFADGSREEGFRYLSQFEFDAVPCWKFHVNGVEVRKEFTLEYGTNNAALRYQICNRTKEDVQFRMIPFLQFVPKGKEMRPEKQFVRRENRIKSEEASLRFETNGIVEAISDKTEEYYYSYDVCDGRRASGRAAADHEITIRISSGETQVLAVLYFMEADPSFYQEACSIEGWAEKLICAERERVKKLEEDSCLSSELARALAGSADMFISDRESTGGKTILAGFPFFEDWGRDTMIALPGICISTGRYDTAKSILRTFAKYEKDGLMPNLFPEGGKEPLYNTVDAALLFINCVWLCFEATKEKDFLSEMYPVMQRIVEGYRKGTHFHIHMDGDGLIAAGAGLDQVTWMDVRIDDILPTPRHGKPVEINALWYNALCIMDRVSGAVGYETEEYRTLAEKVKTTFTKAFWMEEKHCLKDVLSGTKEEEQIRCNQIWAVSLPFTMPDREKEKQIVDTVFEKLYTPYGLRTLAPEDVEFHPCYGGTQLQRDMAYHQGTVWPFLLGEYYLAYLKVHDNTEEAKAYVYEALEMLLNAMREGCAGQLPEIYDGENPTSSRGCFAQAWSVGEILRVYRQLEGR